ncbi:hypothetical protein IMZ48_49115 [Candidatus Bathyarchaeota archaeon]|nr:hypothetical protein [Candidatus Bathyarchaeota archaeon]
MSIRQGSRSSSPSSFAESPSDAFSRRDSKAHDTIGKSPPPSSTHTSKSHLSSLRRWGTDRITAGRKPDDPEEGIRGELGLRLVHSSPEPLVDIIFVHGLRGGSIRTWRKGTDPRYFWPQCWLPLEKGFENASIHTFGYDSDWGTAKQSMLSVHDFGRTLYEEMRASQYLRSHDEVGSEFG